MISAKLNQITSAMEQHDSKVTAAAEACSNEAKQITEHLTKIGFVDKVGVYDTEDIVDESNGSVLNTLSYGIVWDGIRLQHTFEDEDEGATPLLGCSREIRIACRHLLDPLLTKILDKIKLQSEWLKV